MKDKVGKAQGLAFRIDRQQSDEVPIRLTQPGERYVRGAGCQLGSVEPQVLVPQPLPSVPILSAQAPHGGFCGHCLTPLLTLKERFPPTT